jgi:hypothetical protein
MSSTARARVRSASAADSGSRTRKRLAVGGLLGPGDRFVAKAIVSLTTSN